MVIAKENPIGLDAIVARLQNALENNLSWKDSLTIYPRCYQVKRDGNRTIEHYDAKGEYDVLIEAETNKCFFVHDAQTEREGVNRFSTQLDAYFTLNLEEIKSDILHRADQEVQADVLMALSGVNDVEVQDVITGIEDVYRSLRYKETDDTQPYHCFRIVLNVLRFRPDQKC